MGGSSSVVRPSPKARWGRDAPPHRKSAAFTLFPALGRDGRTIHPARSCLLNGSLGMAPKTPRLGVVLPTGLGVYFLSLTP
jgi:hypothetical protein